MIWLLLGLDAVRIAVGLVFLLSVVGKLRDPWGFVQGVVEYQVLPPILSTFFGFVLLPLEGGVAALLLGNWHISVGTSAATILLISFFIAVAINIHRERAIPCHCFGTGSAEQVSRQSLVRISLLIAAIASIVLGRQVVGSYNTGATLDQIYFGNRLLDNVLRLSLGVTVLIAGLWLLVIPDLLRPWRAAFTRRQNREGMRSA